jgi:hypothetical protein
VVVWRYICGHNQEFTDNVIIEFKNISSQLGTRIEGESIRKNIVVSLHNNEKVIFDLAGVDIMSNSFADECFAKLTLFFNLETIKEFTHFQNASPFIRAVIANSFKERLSQLQSV